MISVLIRAGSKTNVFDCIKSIKDTYPKARIVVSVVASKIISKRLNDLGIKNCVVPAGNISKTTNRGLALVKKGKVIVTDSDTIFGKGCIEKLDRDLNNYDVVKALLIFKTEATLTSKLIANLRFYFNSKGSKMFTPGLAFNLSIKKKVGGYFFDENVLWGEDSEFSNRVEGLTIKTFFDKRAMLYHPLVPIKHDLAGAFLIGARKPERKSLLEIVKKRLTTYEEINKGYGLKTLAYGILWYFFFDLGKISKYLGDLGRDMEKIAWKN